MTTALRAVSLLVGVGLIIAPTFFLLQFAHGVGEPPTENYFSFFSPTLITGCVLGGGLFLVGLPQLVAGESTPTFRWVAGALIFISAFAFLLAGFSGEITKIITPLVLCLELVVFRVFVFPAKNFLCLSGVKNG